MNDVIEKAYEENQMVTAVICVLFVVAIMIMFYHFMNGGWLFYP